MTAPGLAPLTHVGVVNDGDTDYMLSLYGDGSFTVAFRPGPGRTDLTWSPELEVEYEAVSA